MSTLLGRTLHEIAQVLESAEQSEVRMLRVLDLLRPIVPYQQCALLKAQPGRPPSLLVAAATPRELRATLSTTLIDLHGRLVDERAHPSARAAANEPVSHLFAQLATYLVLVDQACALAEARREADGVNPMKDEFLALVSHELKTPLASLAAWAHTLRSEKTGPSARTRAVAGIERNVEAQAKLIDELLELACIATADVRLDLEMAEPSTLIKAAVEGQRLRAAQRSIRLETALDDSVDPLVVDPLRIVRVIASLLRNAIQFTPMGGRVGVRLDRVGAHARIRVMDHGKGIAPEALPHVFDRDGTYESPVLGRGGTSEGGLAMVKTVVVAHGGRVRAESLGLEKGSTFTLELPLPDDAPGEAPGALAGIRVLLVDDDDDMRLAARMVLELHGADVTAVASAAAALAALEASRPHVLLSDISMPGDSGYDLMRQIAARDATLPAAALTGFARSEDQARALAAGFRMHLAKPIDALALVVAVATLTGREVAKGLAWPPMQAAVSATANRS